MSFSPVPAPTGAELTRLLLAVSPRGAPSASIGATSVEPAPFSVGSADAATAVTPHMQAASNPAQVTLTNVLMRKAELPFLLGIPITLGAARPAPASGQSIFD